MTSKTIAFFAFLILLTIPASQAVAQNPISTQNNTGDANPVKIIEKTRLEGIDRANRMMRLGDYEGAAAILETIFEKDPQNIEVKNLLATCYERSKDYSKMLLFLKSRLATEPPGYPLYRAVGRTYVLMGFPDSAQSFFYAAVSRAPGNDRAFSTIAEIYHKFGHYRFESEFIDSARVLTGNPTLLADRMGDALAAQRQFGTATLEYLTYMERDTLTARIATERLEAMMRYPESTDTVMAILSERIKTQKENKRLFSTYGRLLMDQSRFEEAFEFFKELDSLDNSNGSTILYFIRECNRHKQFEYAILGGEYFLQKYPESTLKNSVHFAMAEAMTVSGRYDDALALLEAVVNDMIRPAHRAEAILKIGLLYKNHLGDLSQAKKHLNRVIKDFRLGIYDTKAHIGLADVAVREGKFDSAISHYEILQERDLSKEVMEKIEFSLAEIFLFQEDFKEATSRFRQIISRYPRGFYVNDAIQYSLIIGEALDEAPKQIDLFSSAEYFRYTGRDDSLEYYLTKICRVGIPSLAPISYLRLAQMYRDQRRFDEAVASADSLVSLFPASYYFPYGLKLKADVYIESEITRDEALALYRELLEKFATYPFAAEIRDLIRREATTGRI